MSGPILPTPADRVEAGEPDVEPPPLPEDVTPEALPGDPEGWRAALEVEDGPAHADSCCRACRARLAEVVAIAEGVRALGQELLPIVEQLAPVAEQFAEPSGGGGLLGRLFGGPEAP